MFLSVLAAITSSLVSIIGLLIATAPVPGAPPLRRHTVRRAGCLGLSLVFLVASVVKAAEDTAAQKADARALVSVATTVNVVSADATGPAQEALQRAVTVLTRVAATLQPPWSGRPTRPPAPPPRRVAVAPVAPPPVRSTAFWPAGCQPVRDTVVVDTMIAGGFGGGQRVVRERTVARAPTDSTVRRADCILTAGQAVELGAERVPLRVADEPDGDGRLGVQFGAASMALRPGESAEAGTGAGRCRMTYADRRTPDSHRFTVDCGVSPSA